MKSSVYFIPIPNLLIAVGLTAIVIGIYIRWSISISSTLIGIIRMLVQLLLVGFALTFIFETEQPIIIFAVLSIMLAAASWIALRPLKVNKRKLFLRSAAAISSGGVFTLAVVAWLVIRLDPWYEPRYLIPLAGMIFANAMNSVSLSAERFESEIERGCSFLEARRTALQAGLIPITNSLFAVGLVSLPGMMTGQILSGVSPLIAVRYQIVVMCMVFAAAGISSAVYLTLRSKNLDELRQL